jgi:hypothetical protein
MNQIDEVGVPEFVKGHQGISAVEKLLTEFEAHETKEEKSVEGVSESVVCDDRLGNANDHADDRLRRGEASGGDPRYGRDSRGQP